MCATLGRKRNQFRYSSNFPMEGSKIYYQKQVKSMGAAWKIYFSSILTFLSLRDNLIN